MEAEQTITCLQKNRTSSQKNETHQFCTTSGICHFSRFSSSQKNVRKQENYILSPELFHYFMFRLVLVKKKKGNSLLTISKTHQLFLQLQYQENIKLRMNIAHHINYQCFLIPNRISCRYMDKSKRKLAVGTWTKHNQVSPLRFLIFKKKKIIRSH